MNRNAVNDGIRGKDSIAVKDGTITVSAERDGIQAGSSNSIDEDVDEEKEYISIDGGNINVTAGADGIRAETILMISDGNITISSGGGSADVVYPVDIGPMGGFRGMTGSTNTDTDNGNGDNDDSTKGLKAGVAIAITGGTIDIDSHDDAIHSDASLVIDAGAMTISSGDDGIRAEKTLEINGGEITITRCYEGIESSVIAINDGNININAYDDGLNAVGGENYLYINGGYLVMNTEGDGLDSNWQALMTDGLVIVNGPATRGNTAVDVVGGFTIDGGLLVALGLPQMAQAPAATSSQYSLMLTFPEIQPSGSLLHFEDENGQEILTFLPTKEYQTIIFSCPELENTTTCVVYTGGSSTGTIIDGVYTGGSYHAGTEVDGFEITGVVTIVGDTGTMMGGRGG